MVKAMNTKRRGRRGVVSVEAVFVFPILIVAAMIVMELANIALTISMGEIALQRGIQEIRTNDSWEEDDANVIRGNMVKSSQGFLAENNIESIVVEKYESLDALGKAEGSSGSDDSEDSDEEEDEETTASTYPAWKITVDIHKDFITSLPHLLALDENGFQYRFEKVLSYLPSLSEED